MNDTEYLQGPPGEAQPDGGYRLSREKLRFKGCASYPSASARDGVVDVRFHFAFTEVDDRP